MIALPATETGQTPDRDLLEAIQAYGRSVDLGARAKVSLELTLAPRPDGLVP